MPKLPLTIFAVFAGLAIAPAHAFVSTTPVNVPSEWPAEGAFKEETEGSVQDRATISTRGTEVKPDPSPKFGEERLER